MIRIVHAPPIEDVLALYDPALKPRLASAAILQAARSEALGWYRDGAIIAAALLYPRDDGRHELVFACRASLQQDGRERPFGLAAILRTLIRAAHSTAARLPEDVTVLAFCRRDNIAGRRLAWLCGLRPSGGSGTFKIYRLTHEQVRQRDIRIRRHGGRAAA